MYLIGRLLLSAVALVCTLVFIGCGGGAPESCTRVYINMDEDRTILREYERLFPRQAEYGYYKSFYSFRTDSIEQVFEINKHNFMHRSPEFAKGRGMITISQYDRYCVDNRSETDTIFAMTKLEDGKFREFRVFERFDLIHTDESLVRRDLDGSRTNLMHYNSGVGEFTPLDANNSRIAMRRATDIYCEKMYEVTRWVRMDSISETYVKDFGRIFQDDGDVESRLATVNGEPYLSYLRDQCED